MRTRTLRARRPHVCQPPRLPSLALSVDSMSIRQVLELIPDDTKSLYRRALAQWRLGEIEKATQDLESILKAKV